MKIDLPLDGTSRGHLRRTSKGLFQNKYVFEVLLAIAERDRFYPSEIAELTGCAPNQATQIIERLVGGGLVEPLDKDAGQVRNYYRRVASPLWNFALAWAAELAQPPESTVARLTTRRQ